LIAHNELEVSLPIRHGFGFVGERGKQGGVFPKLLPYYFKVGTSMKTQVQTALLSGVVALAGWAAAVDPAAAAVYRGRFDPLYGAPFTDPALAWGGTLQISVNDSCVVAGGSANLANCAGGIQITQSSVELYQATITDPGNPPTTPPTYIRTDPGESQTLNFGSTAGLNGLGWILNFDSNKNLTSVNSTAFNAIQGAANSSLTDYNADDDNLDQAWFSLQFLGNYAQLYWFDKEPVTGLLGIPDEVLLTAGITTATRTYLGICRDDDVVNIPGVVRFFVGPDQCGWSDPDNISPFGAFITFERVPEPATFALVPAALAIMGMVGLRTRRRRSAALPQ
jgi:hypothetical protein